MCKKESGNKFPHSKIFECLRNQSEAIAERWLAVALAAYPDDSAAAFRRQRDRFANPVGHALRVGTRAAVETLLEGRPSDEVCSHLSDIIKIRAVQELLPSQAIGFVFALKDAIRTELRDDAVEQMPSAELAELDRRIDEVALAAFDVYMRYRGQVYEVRINEIKRIGSCEPEEPRPSALIGDRGMDWQSVPDNADGLPIHPTATFPDRRHTSEVLETSEVSGTDGLPIRPTGSFPEARRGGGR
jgi:hypothetical protein